MSPSPSAQLTACPRCAKSVAPGAPHCTSCGLVFATASAASSPAAQSLSDPLDELLDRTALSGETQHSAKPRPHTPRAPPPAAPPRAMTGAAPSRPAAASASWPSATGPGPSSAGPSSAGASNTNGRPSAVDRYIGKTVAGKFLVDELLGAGGMGKVYRARHLALEKTVVLKMLRSNMSDDPTLVARFEREAKAASRLSHQNSIQILDFGQDEDGALFIVMEYVQGKDLRQILRDEFPLDEERLCRIVAQALDALGEAHASNVIHRDLKPENIMVERRPQAREKDHVKVLDFGIAKIQEDGVPGLTKNDVVCGTPQYMAPEQATGSPLDSRCDLYAVGVILYQMTTGSLPFDGANSMEILTRHVRDAPVPPRVRQPGVPISPRLEAIILRAMAKDRANRPQSAGAFRDELVAVADEIHAARAQGKSWPPGPELVANAAPAAREPPAPPLAPPPPATAQRDGQATVRSRPRERPVALIAGGVAALAAVIALTAVVARRKAAPAAPAVAVTTPEAPAPVSPAPTVTPASVVADDPARAAALLQSARGHLALDEFGAAEADLQALLKFHPGNGYAHFLLGKCLDHANKTDESMAEWRQAVKLDPNADWAKKLSAQLPPE